jgi:hypothetical protein
LFVSQVMIKRSCDEPGAAALVSHASKIIICLFVSQVMIKRLFSAYNKFQSL